METSPVHCLEHCYLCCALVTIHSNELVIFPGIAFYGNDKYSVITKSVIHLFMYNILL